MFCVFFSSVRKHFFCIREHKKMRFAFEIFLLMEKKTTTRRLCWDQEDDDDDVEEAFVQNTRAPLPPRPTPFFFLSS